MLVSLVWPTLEASRKEQRLILLYKIINKIACILTGSILTPGDSRTRACLCSWRPWVIQTLIPWVIQTLIPWVIQTFIFSGNDFWLEWPLVWHSRSWNSGRHQIEVSLISSFGTGGNSAMPMLGYCRLEIRIDLTSKHYSMIGCRITEQSSIKQ